ncbi:hypothetical protein [Nonomuraea endophytica]|uniref:Uncharacterized protein n=1 Tax=Nonomuraea endophytica TaxID=714136 RepID=A0A7W8EDS4_9ACTN|nr:hypothetical protein [Nonomuraea endophytica]MBB5076855.1 hypothetical protein [Nonomuraea endophytica]
MAADDRLDDDLEDDELARRLREAHRRVRLLPADEKERVARRYLAICDLAKRDPERAASRLEAFIEGLDDTPRGQENTPGD